MKVFQIVMSVISTLLVAFTLICGFWIYGSGKVTDMASSVSFHMGLGVAAFVSVLITTILSLIRK